MHRHSRSSVCAAVLLAALAVPAAPARAQDTGAVRGTVTLTENGGAVHGAVVLVVGTGLVGLTAEDGSFEIGNVPPGRLRGARPAGASDRGPADDHPVARAGPPRSTSSSACRPCTRT